MATVSVPPKLRKREFKTQKHRLYASSGNQRFTRKEVEALLDADDFFDVWVFVIAFKIALTLEFL